MPLGLAYAVWSGIGTLGAVLISIYVFGQASTPATWIGAAMVIAGVAVMNLSSTTH